MLLIGLMFRRLWAIPLAVSAWGVLLLATGVIGIAELPAAFVIGGANVAVGVLTHRLLAWPFRRLRAVS
jgi:hypothetical protein